MCVCVLYQDSSKGYFWNRYAAKPDKNTYFLFEKIKIKVCEKVDSVYFKT